VISWDTLAEPFLAILIGYGLGSIPFGLVLTRLAGLGDVRQIGSGNIGATNVLRTGRKGLAAATLLLDVAKGAAAVLLVRYIWSGMGLDGLAGIAAFLGHLYPVWLGFRGGKGVATMLGVVGAIAWPVMLIMAATWLLVLFATRYSSAGGMSAAVSASIAAFFMDGFGLAMLFAGLALLVLWKHRENIGRLLNGTEPRVGRSVS
jgi:glycerol-3-phosphate acyltransferase PlsY